MSPEWDDETPGTPPIQPGQILQGDGVNINWGYPDSSGVPYYTTSYTTTQMDWGTTVSGDLTLRAGTITFKPSSSDFPSIKYDFSEASWYGTWKTALGMFLGPLLCILSRLFKKPMGIS
jgi:hypothetical protein